jgi:polysaccharide biosynthesis protein PslH
MNVLQLTYRVPYPATDGGAIGIYTITKGLHENGCVIDLVAINTPKHSQPADAMSGFVRSQHDVFVDTSISVFKLLKNILFKQIPYNVERFISTDVSDKLIELLSKNSYDFIQIEGAFVAYYIDVIQQHSTAPIIVRTHNIEYVIWQRLAINERNPLKKWFFNHLAKRLMQFESRYYNKANGIAAITPEDEKRLRELQVTKPIKVVPVGVILDQFKIKPLVEQEANTVFSISALDWQPNIEGLNWFLQEVWPLVLQRKPEVQLHIAGKSTPDWLKNMSIPNATIHGFVDDASLFKQRYQLMLVSLLSGGGMRVKIIEGLAENKCMISTTIGAEGVAYTHQKNIVIADTPTEWVDAICYYLENKDARTSIEQQAGELAQQKYDNVTVTRGYIELFNELKA